MIHPHYPLCRGFEWRFEWDSFSFFPHNFLCLFLDRIAKFSGIVFFLVAPPPFRYFLQFFRFINWPAKIFQNQPKFRGGANSVG